MTAPLSRTLLPGCAGLALAALLHGCAAPKPIPQPVDYYRQVTRDVAAKPSLLVVSGCAMRDEVGNDYYLMDSAERRARDLGAISTGYLASRGLPVTGTPVVMMCGGHSGAGSAKLEFVRSVQTKDQVTAGRFPHAFDVGAAKDPAQLATIQSVMQSVRAMPSSVVTSAGQAPSTTSLSHLATELTALRTATGADHLWVVANDRLEVSGGKVATAAFLTALVSLGTVASAPQGGSSDMVALVDLRDARIVWKKSVGSLGGSTTATPIAGTSTYSTTSNMTPGVSAQGQAWAETMFAPLVDPDAPTLVSTPVRTASTDKP